MQSAQVSAFTYEASDNVLVFVAKLGLIDDGIRGPFAGRCMRLYLIGRTIEITQRTRGIDLHLCVKEAATELNGAAFSHHSQNATAHEK